MQTLTEQEARNIAKKLSYGESEYQGYIEPISQPLVIQRLKLEYKNTDILQRIEELQRDVLMYRKSRGDGNCFYRAFFFYLIEDLTAKKNFTVIEPHLQQIEQRKDTLKILLENSAEFQKISSRQRQIYGQIDESFLLFIRIIKALKGPRPIIAEYLRILMCEVAEFDMAAVIFIRYLALKGFKQYESELQYFVPEGTNVTVNIKTYGVEADNVEATALSEYLNIAIYAKQLKKGGNQDWSLEPGNLGGTKRPSDGSVFLFFRQGHYDLCYSVNDVKTQYEEAYQQDREQYKLDEIMEEKRLKINACQQCGEQQQPRHQLNYQQICRKCENSKTQLKPHQKEYQKVKQGLINWLQTYNPQEREQINKEQQPNNQEFIKDTTNQSDTISRKSYQKQVADNQLDQITQVNTAQQKFQKQNQPVSINEQQSDLYSKANTNKGIYQQQNAINNSEGLQQQIQATKFEEKQASKQLQDQFQNMKQQFENLQNRIAPVNEIIKELEKQFPVFQQQLSKHQQQLLLSDNGSADNNSQQLLDENKIIRQKYEQLQQIISNQKNDINDKDQVISKLNQQIKDSEEQKKKLEQENQQLKEQQKLSNDQIDKLSNQLVNQPTQEQFDRQNKDYQQRFTNQGLQIQDLEVKIIQKDQEITKLKKEKNEYLNIRQEQPKSQLGLPTANQNRNDTTYKTGAISSNVDPNSNINLTPEKNKINNLVHEKKYNNDYLLQQSQFSEISGKKSSAVDDTKDYLQGQQLIKSIIKPTDSYSQNKTINESAEWERKQSAQTQKIFESISSKDTLKQQQLRQGSADPQSRASKETQPQAQSHLQGSSISNNKYQTQQQQQIQAQLQQKQQLQRSPQPQVTNSRDLLNQRQPTATQPKITSNYAYPQSHNRFAYK